MTGADVLNRIVGQRLSDAAIQSFKIDDRIVDEVNVVYLRFGDWIHITCDDGYSSVRSVSSEKPEEITPFQTDSGFFQYPLNTHVHSIPAFANCLGAELLSWTELVDKDENTDLNFYDSLGIRLHFGNGQSISVYSDRKDDTCICEGLPNNVKEKVPLRHT